MKALRAPLLFTVLAATAIWATPASAAVYAGETTQGDPIAITVSKDGKRVTRVAIAWESRCDSQQQLPFGGVLDAVAKAPSVIRPGDNPLLGGAIKRGRLKATGLGSMNFGNDVSALIQHRVTGKFGKSKATGTWTGHAEVMDGGGNTVDKCDTGTVRWTALHGPNTYGGSTTAGEPVVVQTNRTRSKVTYLGIGWRAACQPDGGFRFAEEFGNFPLTSSGSFGDGWTDEYPFKDGSGKNSFTYGVNAQLRKKRGTGTFSVHLVRSDASGGTTSTCDTGTVHWSVDR